MHRSLSEWIGRSDDSRVPPRVRLRVLEHFGADAILNSAAVAPPPRIPPRMVTVAICESEYSSKAGTSASQPQLAACAVSCPHPLTQTPERGTPVGVFTWTSGLSRKEETSMARTIPKKALALPRALIRKHARITKKGRVELEGGWSDKRIAKKSKAKVGVVRQLRGDLYGRLRKEVERAPRMGK
jgi:hypothetical protein